MIAFIFEVVLVMVVGCFGIVGNCLLISNFIKLKMKVNFHRLMIALAVYDTLYISLSILVFAIPEIFEDYKIKGYHFYIAPRAVPLIQVALTGSVYCTVSISLERYLTVCYPFYLAGKNWSSKRYIVPIVLFSLLYNITRFMEMQTTCTGFQAIKFRGNETYPNVDIDEATEDNKTQTVSCSDIKQVNYHNATWNGNNFESNVFINESVPEIRYSYTVELTLLRKNKYYYSIYIIGLNFVFNGLIPFSLIITLNMLLYRQLKLIIKTSSFVSRTSSLTSSLQQKPSQSFDAYKNRNENKRQRGVKLGEVMLAKVSLVIVVVFIICHSIKWIPNIYELVQRLDTDNEKLEWPFWIDTITQISHFLMVLNSSTNFYIYWITHTSIPLSICCAIQQRQGSSDIEM